MNQLDSENTLGKLGVSRETIADLKVFSADIERWSKSINLISVKSTEDIWQRHIVDSAQLIALASSIGPKWCDLGSGGGLPGLVVAILLRELAPDTVVTLIESDKRKSVFLKMEVRAFDLNASVVSERAEKATAQEADVVSARALAPLEPLLGLVFRHINEGGTALLPKGRNFLEEVEQARRSWHFDLEAMHSLVDVESRILRITNLKPKGVSK